jgi:hypothetical protein
LKNPLFKKIFTDNLNHDTPAAQHVWTDIDKMYALDIQSTEHLLERLNALEVIYLLGDVLRVNTMLTRSNLVAGDMDNDALTRFLRLLILMLESKLQPYVVPNPIVLSTALTAGQKTVWLDPEKNQNITDANKHSFIQTFCAKYDNAFTKSIFGVYDQKLGHAWSEENMTPAATHIQNNTVDIPTLAYHGNMVVQNTARNTPVRDVKCVGHLGNSYPGVASIREGRGRVFQPDSVAKMHIM